MDVRALHRSLRLTLANPARNGSAQYNNVLASLVLVLGDEEIEAHGAWFDYRTDEDDDEDEDGTEIGVHVRLLLESGLIVTDFDFSFEGAPYVRYFPWSQVREMRLIGRNPSAPVAANVWLETAVGTVEFAGVREPDERSKIMTCIRAHLG